MARTDQRKPRDMLSSLPDEILSHILSALETKYAVRTTVLSRRWKDLWTTVSNLDLVDSHYVRRWRPLVEEERDLVFAGFVDRILSNHKNLNSLRRLRLHFSMDSDATPNFWSEMELEPESQLEEIDVRPSYRFPEHWLPESFYTLRTLKVLKLDNAVLMPVGGSVYLPSLKILQLVRVDILDCELLARLLSGSPVLEIVRMKYCCSKSSNNNEYRFTASLLSLKSLSILGLREYGSYGAGFSFAIEAPCLEQLHLENFELQFSGSSQLQYLVSARIDTDWSHGFRILTQISNAKELRLSRVMLSILAAGVQGVQLPIFPKLTHLTLEGIGSSRVLHSLLDSASQLQSLVIHFGGVPSMGSQWEISEPARTPECLLSSLKEIEINDLVAFENEMKVVAYLLKVGVVLKKLNIRVVGPDHGSNGRDLCASLLKLPKGSSTCEIVFFFSTTPLYDMVDDYVIDNDELVYDPVFED